MRSLQVKFSALVVALLGVASVSLALIATQHERSALENEVEKRAFVLAANLAGDAKDPMLEVQQGGLGEELTLDRLIQEVAAGEGVVAARLLDHEGTVVASLDAEQRGAHLAAPEGPCGTEPVAEREGSRLRVRASSCYRDVRVGEAQVELDLRSIVGPVVQSNTQQLTAAAVAVLCLGVVAGVIFVGLLVGPLGRLRVGVERLAAGDVTVRVPPTSRDEVGELTRAFNEMGDSLLQKQRLQHAFGRYVDGYVLNQLLEGPEEEMLGGIEREVTVLFADIRRFTRLSEGLKAHVVVGLLNEMFQLASDRILERGGTIDKFIGDSVMAYFGAPVPHPDHAQRAVAAAIDIARSVAERNLKARDLDAARGTIAPVEVGIGIHTGVVVVGNIGSDRRTDFTAVGDAVNVAHRLEKLARPGEILVSEVVQRRVRGTARLRFEGERQLSGREEPVHVYSVELDPKGASKPAGTPSALA